MANEKEIVLFETEDRSIALPVSVESDTVWLSANQMAILFGRDEKTIRKHINNVFSEEELTRENNTQKMRVVGVKQPVPFYTLDVIISVGYRVKSKRGVEFRRWWFFFWFGTKRKECRNGVEGCHFCIFYGKNSMQCPSYRFYKKEDEKFR